MHPVDPELSRSQNRFHRPHVNANGLSRPRAPSLDRCSQERRFHGSLRFVGTRHRSRGLATNDPASDARSPSRSLSRGKARPIVGSADSSPTVARGHTPPVDFCNRLRSASTTTDHRTPQNLASGRPLAQLVSWPGPFGLGPELRMATPLAKRSQPRVHGPGALPEAAASMLRHLPLRSLATGASPQPDRLGHLLSLLAARIWLETPDSAEPPRREDP
jgi:hypothetical protein